MVGVEKYALSHIPCTNCELCTGWHILLSGGYQILDGRDIQGNGNNPPLKTTFAKGQDGERATPLQLMRSISAINETLFPDYLKGRLMIPWKVCTVDI